MKSLVLSVLLLFIAGCGGTQTPKVEIPADADVRAGIKFKDVSGVKRAEVGFFLSAPVSPGVKESPPLKVITVDEATIDGKALTASTSESGSVVYTSDVAQPAASNTITARINGKLYEGKTVPSSVVLDKQMVITLMPK